MDRYQQQQQQQVSFSRSKMKLIVLLAVTAFALASGVQWWMCLNHDENDGDCALATVSDGKKNKNGGERHDAVACDELDEPTESCPASRSLGRGYRVAICETKPKLDIRQYVHHRIGDGEYVERPTRNGVSLSRDQWRQLISHYEWIECQFAFDDRRGSSKVSTAVPIAAEEEED